MALGQEIAGKPLRICDGCGLSEYAVAFMFKINEERNVYICDSCVRICAEIIIEKSKENEVSRHDH